MGAPLDRSQLLLALYDGQELRCVDLPDFQLVCFQRQRSDDVWLSGVPIDARDADAAPDLRVKVTPRDELHDLLSFSADHEVLHDHVALVLLGLLLLIELQLGRFFDVTNKARLNLLAKGDDGVKSGLPLRVENVGMRVAHERELLGHFAESQRLLAHTRAAAQEHFLRKYHNV